MQRLLICLATLSLGCTSTPQSSQSSLATNSGVNCFAYYQQQLQQEGHLWGFGDSGIRTVAIDAARADLAKQITVHVTSHSEVRETNVHADFSMLSRSIVDQHLGGVQTDRICQDHGKYQAIVKLPRSVVVHSAKQKMAEVQQQGQQILSLTKSQDSTSQQIKTYVLARDFLASQGEVYRSQMTLCQAFQGCRGHDSAWLGELQSFVRLNGISEPFKFHPADAIAQDLQSELMAILSKEGYQISSQTHRQLASASCHRTVFEQTADLRELLVKVQCQIIGQSEGVQVFHLAVSATGSGRSPEQAFQVARNLLQKDSAAR